MTQASIAATAAAWPAPDKKQISEFLTLLGKEGSACRLRAFFPKGHPKKPTDQGRKANGSAAQIEAWQREERGVYLVIGNGGDSESEITTCPAFFIEHDDKPKNWQVGCWQKLGLPEPTVQVDTGGRSIHSYWVLHEPMDPQAWKEIQRRLLVHAAADTNVGDIPRVMRLPGTWHMNAAGQPDDMARIISSAGHRYSPDQIEACLPLPSPEPPARQREPITLPPGHLPRHGDARPLQEVMDGLERIPPILPDNGEREKFRSLAWGLLCAVREAGSDDAMALQLLEAHSPQVRDAADYLKTEPHSITAATFWKLARDHGWRPEAERRSAAQQPPQAATAAPPADAPAPAAEAPTAPGKARLSDREKLAELRGMAADLLQQGTPFTDRVPLLRAQARELDFSIRDEELRRLIWDARRAAAGGSEILKPGDWIDLTPTRWSWQGIVMPAALNLLIALPKVGKTSLILAMLGAWHRGEPSFLGLDLIGPCPPVLIVGTDMPISDWGRMLQEVGLLPLDHNGRGAIQLTHPIVGLAHAGRPLHLTPEGIEAIAAHAEQHPGLFVLLDSVAAVTGPLGIDENSAELAEPIRDLMEAVGPHGGTVLAIHHASKGRAGESPTLASRGSTALPATASQIINLARMASSNPGAPPDRRIVVKTDGRAGEPQHLLIERTPDGWISHGSAESVALAQHLQEVEDKLNDRQVDALDLVRERWAGGRRTDASDLADALQLAGSDRERKARSTLDQLVRKGLLQSATEVGLHGRTKWFWPVGSDGSEGDRRPSRGGLSQPSEPSDPSYPPEDQKAPSHAWSKGSEGTEGKEGQEMPPRETLRTPPHPSDRIPCTLDGEPGWTRRAAPMGRSVVVIHADGRQFNADREQVADA